MIVGANPVEYPRLAQLLAAAFAENPVSDWLFDGAQDSAHPAFFLAFLRLAQAGGRIEQSLDGSAVALWVDRTGTDPGAQQAATEALDEALGAAYRDRWRVLDKALHPAHLEATSRRLTGYYRRYGFQPTGAIVIPRGPTLHPMWRPSADPPPSPVTAKARTAWDGPG